MIPASRRSFFFCLCERLRFHLAIIAGHRRIHQSLNLCIWLVVDTLLINTFLLLLLTPIMLYPYAWRAQANSYLQTRTKKTKPSVAAQYSLAAVLQHSGGEISGLVICARVSRGQRSLPKPQRRRSVIQSSSLAERDSIQHCIRDLGLGISTLTSLLLLLLLFPCRAWFKI